MNIAELNALMIKNDTKNRLQKGKRCHNEGLVLDIRSICDKEYGSLDVYGKVMSDKEINIYETNISFDLKNATLIYTECNCKDFKENCDFNSTYICEHVAGTFYRFIEMLEEKITSDNKREDVQSKDNVLDIDYSENLVKTLDDLSKTDKERVNIQVNLVKKEYSKGNVYYEADFKIGNKKLYVVKNISELISSMRNGRSISYGKEFTYNPANNYFCKEDENIVDFLEEYVSLNEPLEKKYEVHKANNNIFGKNKNIIISQAALKRFLCCAASKIISYNDEKDYIDIEVKEENLPLKFNVKENNGKIQILLEDNIPKAMTYKGDVYLYNNYFYIPKDNQVKFYKKLNEILERKKVIEFEGNDKQYVFNKLLPILETIADEINIDEELTKNIIREELNLEVYFDREKNKTWATVNAVYGEKTFNMLKGPSDDNYIIRDLVNEGQIVNILNDLCFFADNDKFYFNGDDEKLFNLLTDDLTKLKEKATVFYSDRFKERKIYGANSINASIKDGGGNYLDFTFSIENVDEKELKSIIKAFKENRRFFKLNDESFIDLKDEKVLELFNLIDDLNDETDIKSNNIKLHKSKALYLNDSIIEGEINFIEGKELLEHITEKFTSINDINYEIPMDLNAKLRDYQLSGFKWFKTLSHYEFGGILADEMGLGKTLQTITFLLSEKGKKSIIITPTSLIYNWKSEFEKFAPNMKVKIIHGNKEDRSFTLEEVKEYDVLITTYGTLRNDYDLYKDIIFDYCIIDEGQNIKNPLSLSSEVVKEIKSKVKFALTGTPIENNLIELWSLFDYIMPGYLYSKRKFQEKFIKGNRGTETLKKLIKPFILRRLKKDVMSELPDKIEKKFFVEMTEEQRKAYMAYVNDIREKMKSTDVERDKITIFSYLTKLRQMALDPSILIEGYRGGSGKIDVTIDMLNEAIKDDHKILLFSQFTSVLDNLKKVLDSVGIKYLYLDGSTKASERVELVEEFNNKKDKKVFLISLKAGGTGLNLTSADMVIHFDPWWNPAIEDQATDRAHRFGQKNVVEVIKLIAKGSIEEKILKLQENKKEIINEVMSGNYTNGGFLNSLTTDELKELFN